MSDIDQPMAQRLAEIVADFIDRQSPGPYRQELQQAADDGDYHVQPAGAGMVTVCVGAHSVGEISYLSLRRPDSPASN